RAQSVPTDPRTRTNAASRASDLRISVVPSEPGVVPCGPIVSPGRWDDASQVGGLQSCRLADVPVTRRGVARRRRFRRPGLVLAEVLQDLAGRELARCAHHAAAG